MNNKDTCKEISRQTLKRLPYYLNQLNNLKQEGITQASSPQIAAALGYNDIQVRKDLASVSSSPGRPKMGFMVSELIDDIENFLGYRNTNDAVLIGAGSLGKALLAYKGFQSYGINIAAAFDSDESKVGTEVDGKHVFSLDKLDDLCKRLNIHIGIITVPVGNAQEVCNMLISGGIKAIWNFAPTRLKVPEGILVQNENMAESLALLSQHLKQQCQTGRDV
jgi:redox-sensing transcriptional repressor